jgi:hypothetical protein
VTLRDVEFFVGLETGVWDALVAGDRAADRSRLTTDFLGVYPSGFADRDEHAEQLADGPTMASYSIDEARTFDVTEDAIMLAYLATFVSAGDTAEKQMYISSLWQRFDDQWLNTFSQDTPVE